jgi:hypothetical protein
MHIAGLSPGSLKRHTGESRHPRLSGQASASFLKKRSKKLLFTAGAGR